MLKGPDGKYHVGGKNAPARPSLITGIGAGGRPTRVEDKPGARVYEKPEKPEKPVEPSISFQGADLKVQKFTRAQVLDLMRQKGLNVGMIDDMMKDPSAVSALLD